MSDAPSPHALVTREVRDGVAVLRLADAGRRNVLSPRLVRCLVEAVETCERDETIGALVLTGEGTAFCAGAELGNLLAAAHGEEHRLREVYEGFLRVAACRLPTIAAVNGPAIGAGFNLALACDIRLAAPTALFDCRFARLGLHPGGGHTWMLTRAVGHQRAAAMLLLSQPLTGSQAADAGLALRCVPGPELVDEAVALGRRATDVDPTLLRTIKQSLSESGAETDFSAMVDTEFDRQVHSLHQPSFRTALERARERRRPEPHR
ncbi:enoyl-CoA hydratase-related protein [Streptomyces sp. NPDC026672]|uniref:enoyl-CoA hydratase-related protein n=1 Tax=unclassified Streptomyces TaxID=2593676 RepID=UPI0033D5CF76